jgi:DNA polymerase-3 subunit alpha
VVKQMLKHSLVSFHNHDSYSYSDAILNTKEYVEQAKMLNANSIAISNHGNLSSWLDFQDHCKKNGIKPIAAVEFYAFLSDEPKEKKSYHVLVIAKTEAGYRNLLKLLHLSATIGFYGKPRISEKMLFEHKEGLAVGNACISGFVTKPLMRGDETSARVIAEQFKREFGHNYFFEIMPHNNPLQASVNKKLVQIAKELDINVGVTLDVHFKDNSYEDVYLINGRNRRGITKSIIENNPPEDCLVRALSL